MNAKILLVLFLMMAMTGFAWAQDQSDLERRVRNLEAAQEGIPGHTFQLSGYTNVLFKNPEEGNSSFSTQFSPIFLYKAGDRFLLESELEFDFEGDATRVTLEYSQVDYMLGNNITLVAGKFILPIGKFSERGHPSWINKLPTPPVIYGGHHGTSVGIIPVMSDFGVQARGGFNVGDIRLQYATYMVNGPQAAVDSEGGSAEHAMEEAGHGGAEGAVDYSAQPADDNDDKALGFRLGVIPMRSLEVGVSYYTGKISYTEFDDDTEAPGRDVENSVTLTMLDFTYQTGNFRVEGEYIKEDTSAIGEFVSATHHEEELSIDAGPPITIVEEELEEFETVHPPDERTGYWLQVSHMFPGWIPEVVLRYGTVSVDGEEAGNQSALGLNWWLESSLVVKLAAVSNTVFGEHEDDKTTDLYLQMAFGF